MGRTARLRRAFPWLLAALLVAMVAGYYALTEPVTFMHTGQQHYPQPL